jgi:predicted transcriptional regulator
MTRFEILKLLSANDPFLGYFHPVSCAELAKRTGNPRSNSRSYRASLSTSLRRLRKYGLVRRKEDRSLRPAHGGGGVYVWTISQKGLRRLSWAKEQGKV